MIRMSSRCFLSSSAANQVRLGSSYENVPQIRERVDSLVEFCIKTLGIGTAIQFFGGDNAEGSGRAD